MLICVSLVLFTLVFVACSSDKEDTKNTESILYVTKSSDNGAAGEMRQVVENALPGYTVAFASNIAPVLRGDPINVTADGIIINGNIPATVITRSSASANAVLSIDGATVNSLLLKNLSFQNIERKTDNAETLGGGIINSFNTSNDGTALVNIGNCSFGNNTIVLENLLHGGGILGSYTTSGLSSIGNVDASFLSNKIELTNSDDNTFGRIWGGGLIGAYSENQSQSSSICDITGKITNNQVISATYLNGGGLVGAFVGVDPSVANTPHTAKLGNVDVDFIGNMVTANTNLSGGGLVGSWAWLGDVEIGSISGTFKDNTVKAVSSYIRGGGIIGLRSYNGSSVLGMVSASFINNQITVGASLGGGGIIGLYSAETYQGDREQDKTSVIARIDGASFINNTTTVGGASEQNVYAFSGVVAVSGLNRELVVNNTIFRGNSLYISGQNIWDIGGGALYIGTDRYSVNPNGHVLTLSASDGEITEFSGNSLQINAAPPRFNAIIFGREWDNVSNVILDSKADARLNISPLSGGKVLLHDPVKVDMNNNKTFTVSISGEGHFLWGGRNEFFADNCELRLMSGVTTLAPDFQALGSPVSGNFSVVINQTFTLRIDITDRAANIPVFHQPDNFTVTGKPLLEIVYDGFAPPSGEWLITDKRGGIDETSFTTGEGFVLRIDGEKLFLCVEN